MKLNAFLIIAHNNFQILESILTLLDHEENDFYLHIDAKVKDFDQSRFQNLCRKSSVYFVGRVNCTWGAYSQIDCEYQLLKEAVKQEYAFFHLISGVDMPIKTAEQINTFFRNHMGENFIDLHDFAEKQPEHFIYDRVRYYHFMQEHLGKWTKENPFHKLGYKIIEELSLRIQKLLRIDRTKNLNYPLHKGTQWFSISKEMADYIVSCEPEVQKLCHYGWCVDEVFLQTMAYRSPYADTIVNNCLRYVDWKRGRPYIFQSSDLEELLSAPENMLFARKFDFNTDAEIIRLLKEKLSSHTN